MNGQKELFELFEMLDISYDYYEHPQAPTIAEAMKYWKDIEAFHCKNLFFRNHKGDKHFLVVFYYTKTLDIHHLEKSLKQGKLTFSSEHRLKKYLNLNPGSLSPFGLINDKEKNVHLFIDKHLKEAEKISFHPNINTASLVITFNDFMKFLNYLNVSYEFIDI
jgi:Ala-tRNA(Pro) deacylase